MIWTESRQASMRTVGRGSREQVVIFDGMTSFEI
jgi:hypothetical protein